MRRSRIAPAVLGLGLFALGSSASQVSSTGFVENRGQVQGPVRYYQTGASGGIYFTPAAVVFDLREQPRSGDGADRNAEPALSGGADGEDASSPETFPRRRWAVYAMFCGADPSPHVTARQEVAGHHHFLLGAEPEKWRVRVPAFAEVVYEGLWPGIDLVFRRESGALLYEIVVHPGGDPSLVSFGFQGATRVFEPTTASEEIVTPLGSVRHFRSGTAGEFRWADDAAPARDNPAALAWSTYLGGSAGDRAYDVLLDGSRNPVVAGQTESPDFPTSPGAQDPTWNGGRDTFVTKLSASGSALIWSTLLGGDSDDVAFEIALDPSENVLVTGRTGSANFPATPGAYDNGYAGGEDVFVAKLSSMGDSLLWGTFLGGAGDDGGRSLGFDGSGNVLVAGYTGSPEFPATPGAYDVSFNGTEDTFVSALSPAGTTLVWSTFLGGSDFDIALSLAVDQSGNIVTSGLTGSGDFPTTTGAFDRSYNGGDYDFFVAEILSSGSGLRWSTYLGGNGADPGGYGLLVDPAGNVVVAGMTLSPDYPATPGAFDTSHNGGFGDLFVTKIASSGSALVWSTFLGGTGDDFGGYDLALDVAGNILIPGMTYSSDFPITPGGYDASFNGDTDATLSELSASGRTLVWSSYLGGGAYDLAHGVTTDGRSGVVITGMTRSPEFPVTSGAYDTEINSTLDGFVTCFHLPTVRESGAMAFPEPAPLSWVPVGRQGSVRFTLPAPAPVTLDIYSCEGRLVRRLEAGTFAAGSHELEWDGADEKGRAAKPGVYFIRLRSGQSRSTGRILVAQ